MTARNTSGLLTLNLLGATPIPLPDNQNLDGFTASSGSTTFTVPETGKYLITYDVNSTVGVAMTTQVSQNGTPISGSVVSSLLGLINYSATTFADLSAGDTIRLELQSLLNLGLAAGDAASLTLIRIA
jgi:hypothetical protein